MAKNLVQNFNAKLRRLINKGINPELLPRRITKNDIRNKSVREFATSFLNRANQRWQVDQVLPTGEFISKREAGQLKRLQSRANRLREQNRNRYNSEEYRLAGELARGVEPGVKRTVGEDRYKEDFKPLSRSKFKTRGEYLRYLEKVERLASPNTYKMRDEQIKEWFIKGVSSNTNNDELINELRKIDTNTFIKNLITSDLDVEWTYSTEAMNSKISKIAAIFNIEIEL